MGSMTGFIHSMYVGKNSQIKMTSVDYVCNATIAAAWKRSLIDNDTILVYNCTDAKENSITWKESCEMSRKYFLKYVPYEKLIWYPQITLTSFYFKHIISLFFFQILPAIILDFFCLFSGKKAM